MFTCPSRTIGSITRVSLRVLILVGFLFYGVSKMKDKAEKAVNLLAAVSNVYPFLTTLGEVYCPH